MATVYCIGRNFADHAKELGNPVPSAPLIFLKPASSVRDRLVLPVFSSRLDPEVEVVVRLGRGGRGWSEAQALQAISGYAVGLDVTARDRQEEAKTKGHPWAVAKGFYGSAVLGPWVEGAPEAELEMGLEVNGKVRQKGRLDQMQWSPAALVCHLSSVFRLEAGDWVFTGTPPGVGPVVRGDMLRAWAGASRLELTAETGDE